MDINKILNDLRQEREQLEEAILSLERLALGGGKRRGRPPAWIALARAGAPQAERRGRPAGSKNRNTKGKSSAA
jgi:hypothetical protein